MAIDLDAMDELQRERLRESGFCVPGLSGYQASYQVQENPKRKQAGRGENQLELAFKRHCIEACNAANLWKFWVKPFVLAIGPDTTFEPDFMVRDWANELWVIDTKGPFGRRDWQIKIKIASEKYDMWRWLIVTRPDGVWKAKEVTAEKGIGRKFIVLPWLK